MVSKREIIESILFGIIMLVFVVGIVHDISKNREEFKDRYLGSGKIIRKYDRPTHGASTKYYFEIEHTQDNGGRYVFEVRVGKWSFDSYSVGDLYLIDKPKKYTIRESR